MAADISIHALREEGDKRILRNRPVVDDISIHALREEGDSLVQCRFHCGKKFLSTPSARRATNSACARHATQSIFLSTPSARRATGTDLATLSPQEVFLSTPSARRATRGRRRDLEAGGQISIHALREEGDVFPVERAVARYLFLSTPSARRATDQFGGFLRSLCISIHALREEGDPAFCKRRFSR